MAPFALQRVKHFLDGVAHDSWVVRGCEARPVRGWLAKGESGGRGARLLFYLQDADGGVGEGYRFAMC
jgi:hypothetical protein